MRWQLSRGSIYPKLLLKVKWVNHWKKTVLERWNTWIKRTPFKKSTVVLNQASMLPTLFGRYSLHDYVRMTINYCFFFQFLIVFVRSVVNLIRNPLTSIVQVSLCHSVLLSYVHDVCVCCQLLITVSFYRLDLSLFLDWLLESCTSNLIKRVMVIRIG